MLYINTLNNAWRKEEGRKKSCIKLLHNKHLTDENAYIFAELWRILFSPALGTTFQSRYSNIL